MTAAQKTALVTGAGGGIGRAVVAQLLQAGYAVAAVDLALADLPCALPAAFAALSADVTDEARLAQVVAETLARFGRLDAVVHLAGVIGHGTLADESVDEWRRILDVNLTSAFLLARATRDALKATGGSLLLTASVNGRNGGSALSASGEADSRSRASSSSRAVRSRPIASPLPNHIVPSTRRPAQPSGPSSSSVSLASMRACSSQTPGSSRCCW